MSESIIVYGLCAAIVSLSLYVVSLVRTKWKDAKEDKKSQDSLLIQVVEALTKSSIAIENNSKVVQQNTEALYKVKYRRNEDFNSGG